MTGTFADIVTIAQGVIEVFTSVLGLFMTPPLSIIIAIGIVGFAVTKGRRLLRGR